MAQTKPEKLSKETKRALAVLRLELPQISRTDSIFNANQIQKIFNSTPKRWVYDRPARGGGRWNYVRAAYVRRTLDGLFGFNWDFEVETTVQEAFEVAKVTGTCVVKGTLTGRTKINNEWHTVKKTQFGRQEVKFKRGTKDPLDFGNDMKGAATDAFKKCASMLGIAADIYDPAEFIEIEVVGAESTDERSQATQEQIKRAKKSIKKESVKVPADVRDFPKDTKIKTEVKDGKA